MKLMNNLSIEQRMTTEWGDKFYPEQRAEILDGARLGINAEAYANPDYDHGIMKEIKVGLLQDPSLEKYIGAFVCRKNMHCSISHITVFVAKNVNVDVMLQLECHRDVFRTIGIMLLEDYDFSMCENSNDVMNVFDMYEQQDFDEMQLNEISIGLERNVNVSIYADRAYHWGQMQMIRCGLERNLDISKYADPRVPLNDMIHMYQKLCKQKGVPTI